MHYLSTNIDSSKIPQNTKKILKNALTSNLTKFVFIGDNLDHIILEIASSFNAIILDIDDHDDYPFDADILYIRKIKNRFSHILKSRSNVIEIYAAFNDDNTDVIANSECIINFRV
jgi:hypothetical protein